MRKCIGSILTTLSLLLVTSACEVKRPDYVIADSKMEEVLYDYHIAKAMGENVSYNEHYKRALFMESVFKKHGVTQAEFDSTMSWYSRYPEGLAKIYESITQKLKATQDNVNYLIAVRDDKPVISQEGDSINVWAWDKHYIISGTPLDNLLTFNLPSDEYFEARDTLRWTVDYRFLTQEPDSITAPVMAMHIAYDKDTLIHASTRIEASGTASLALWADTLGAIKDVRGYIYYPARDNESTLLIDRIELMRYHAKDSIATPSETPQEKVEAKPAEEAKPAQKVEKTAPKRVAKPEPKKVEKEAPKPMARQMLRPTTDNKE